MTVTGGRSIQLVIAGVVALGTGLLAQSSSQIRDWQDTALADNPQLKPKQACAALVAQTGYDLSRLSPRRSSRRPATRPDYCRVVGLIQPEIRFEVNLPANWNGRLYMFGNGGYAGEAIDGPPRQAMARRAIARGFATAQTNTGHDGIGEPLGTFASSPQKLVDYAFRAVHVTAVTAKALLQTYYSGPVRRAYFDGCSTGGRQGLISAQRFPDDFDGIAVGAPVLNFSGTMIGYARDQKALAAAPLNADAIKTVADAVTAKCDALDGVKDGVIDDPRRCAFTPSADIPKCGGDSPVGRLPHGGAGPYRRNDLFARSEGAGRPSSPAGLWARKRDGCRGLRGAERARGPVELRRDVSQEHCLRQTERELRLAHVRRQRRSREDPGVPIAASTQPTRTCRASRRAAARLSATSAGPIRR